jgi:hypothetical protein
MKKTWRTLVLLLCLCMGCVSLPKTKEPPKPAKAEAEKPKRPPTCVTFEQVNETNAHEMGRALAEELDHAQGMGKPGKGE